MKLNHTFGHKSKAEALRHAHAEKKRLGLGRQWKIYVHKNMGWFWSFDHGPNIHVTPFVWRGQVASYSCLVGENHTGTFCSRGRTPQIAARKTLKDAKNEVAYYQKLLNEVQKAIMPS